MSFPCTVCKVLININSRNLILSTCSSTLFSIIICLVIGNVFCLGLKSISFVFLTVIGKLLAFSQGETLWSWSLRSEVSTSGSLCSKNIPVSSANNINLRSLKLEQAGRSLI